VLPKSRFTRILIRSWNEFLNWYGEFSAAPSYHERRWIFRGERKSFKYISPTLERAARDSNISFDQLLDLEKGMLNEFKRRLHHYVTVTPPSGDYAEWLSMMRHFGAPTRLLDWSYSPFVAAYFAIERAYNEPCVVWALASTPYTSPELIKNYDRQRILDDFDALDLGFVPEDSKKPQAALLEYFKSNPQAGLQLVNPYRLSERATIQKSAHLVPTDLSLSFEDNILANDNDHDGLTKICIKVDGNIRKDFIFHLYRMNIDRATLFPGLQGFTESLQTRMVIPEVLSK
jgi:hypothetical protein